MARKIFLLILAPAVMLAADFNGKWDAAVVTNAARIPFRMEVSESPARVCFFEDAEPVCSSSARIAEGKLTAQWDYLNSQLTLSAADGGVSGSYVNLRTQRATRIEAKPQQTPAPP